MTEAHGDSGAAGLDEDAGGQVVAPESVSPKRRRRQVRDELLQQSDADELQELLELVEDRLRDTPKNDAQPPPSRATKARSVTTHIGPHGVQRLHGNPSISRAA